MTKYTEKDMTPFFPAGVKPKHRGAYQVSFDDGNGPTYFQNWNGRFWGLFCTTPNRAADSSNSNFRSVYQFPSWRGLSFDPSAEAK